MTQSGHLQTHDLNMTETQKIPWHRLAVEATAIVGSILLAFSIDAWWQDRNEIDVEQRLLAVLKVEFEQNEKLMRQAVDFYRQRYLEAVEILEYLEQDPTEMDEAEFEQLINGLLLKRSFHLESGAHDGVVSSGELNLIRDHRLRSRLAAWPSYVSEWSEEEATVFSFPDYGVNPYLLDRIRLRTVSPEFASFPDGEPLPPIPSGSNDAISLAFLTTSVEFDNLVYKRTQSLWYAARDGETLLAQLSSTLELIRQNLGE